MAKVLLFGGIRYRLAVSFVVVKGVRGICGRWGALDSGAAHLTGGILRAMVAGIYLPL